MEFPKFKFGIQNCFLIIRLIYFPANHAVTAMMPSSPAKEKQLHGLNRMASKLDFKLVNLIGVRQYLEAP